MTHLPDPRIERIPSPQEGVEVIELEGELDLAAHERFQGVVDEVLAASPRLVVADVEAVDFMDSTMLREVLRAHRSLEENGARLVVAGAQPAVTRLLELTGTNGVLMLADSRAAALD